MKKIIRLLPVIFGMSIISVMAQKADSVVVIYNSQKTIIPVPEFGSQTTIKLADSIEIIEIGVSRRKPFDNSITQQIALTPDKPIKKVKWFSQIDAGYTVGFATHKNNGQLIFNSQNTQNHFNMDNFNGYKINLSVFEKERIINNKYSYISGFKTGFTEDFRKGKNPPIISDTLNEHYYYGYFPITFSRIPLLFPFGFRYHFNLEKSAVIINMGANIGFSIDFMNRSMDSFRFGPPFLQPYLGMEIGKIGLLMTSEFKSSRNIIPYSTNPGVTQGLALTYRFF